MLITRMTTRRRLPLSALLALLILVAPACARRAMGGGGGAEEEEEDGGGAGALSSAQGRMRSVMCRSAWVVDPLLPPEVRASERVSPELADHVSGILGSAPLHVRLRERPVGGGGAMARQGGGARPPGVAVGGGGGGGEMFRAVGSIGRLAPTGKRVRATWTSGPPSRPPGFGDDRLLRMRYEEACATNFNGLEIEVTLPRVKTGGGAGKGGMPAVVYRFPVTEGDVNPQGFVPACRGVVKLYPEGRKRRAGVGARGGRSAEEEDDGGIEVGRVDMHAAVAGASPLVDPAWAKGRKFFWGGRPAGKM